MNSAKSKEKKYLFVFYLVISIFFLWGIAFMIGKEVNNNFEDILSISKSESEVILFSVFGAYALLGIPSGFLIKKLGYPFLQLDIFVLFLLKTLGLMLALD